MSARSRVAALRSETELGEEAVAELVGEMTSFLDPFTSSLVRREQRAHVVRYFRGRFRNLPRRTIEPIANSSGIPADNLRKFISSGTWDDAPIRTKMVRDVSRTLGRENGVLVVDGSGFPKKGTESVGVQRQYCGRLGKQDNCQVGEFLAYASGGSYTLVDGELYLPKQWLTKDKKKQARIPAKNKFLTRWELADELLQKWGSKLPHAWVTGDEDYGVPNAFRDRLDKRGERYLLEVKINTRLWRSDINGQVRGELTKVEQVAKSSKLVWKRFHVRDGEKEPLEVEATRIWVVTPREKEKGKPPPKLRVESLLLVRKVDGSKSWQFLSNAEKGTRLSEMVRGAGCRHAVEEVLELAKGDVGLDEYELRSYVGWHHHLTLTLLALWFTVQHHQVLEKKHQRSPFLSSDGLWLWCWTVVPAPTRPSPGRSPASSGGTKRAARHIGAATGESRHPPRSAESRGARIASARNDELPQ